MSTTDTPTRGAQDRPDAMTAVQPPPPPADTQVGELSQEQCRRLLGQATVGRIAFLTDGLPIVLPVNYRWLDDGAGPSVILRVRPGRTIDRAPRHVAFEIDGIDHDHHAGWSVLVRGFLTHLDHNQVELLGCRFDPKPWPRQERTSWLAVTPTTITGRTLHAADNEWAFPSEAYL